MGSFLCFFPLWFLVISIIQWGLGRFQVSRNSYLLFHSFKGRLEVFKCQRRWKNLVFMFVDSNISTIKQG